MQGGIFSRYNRQRSSGVSAELEPEREAPKKNEPEDKPVEEGLVVKELKQHTRYLRDLSGNGLGAKFA